eukprot:scaffold70120_cov54-Phaeocystis_antarctica.AAC.1
MPPQRGPVGYAFVRAVALACGEHLVALGQVLVADAFGAKAVAGLAALDGRIVPRLAAPQRDHVGALDVPDLLLVGVRLVPLPPLLVGLGTLLPRLLLCRLPRRLVWLPLDIVVRRLVRCWCCGLLLLRLLRQLPPPSTLLPQLLGRLLTQRLEYEIPGSLTVLGAGPRALQAHAVREVLHDCLSGQLLLSQIGHRVLQFRPGVLQKFRRGRPLQLDVPPVRLAQVVLCSRADVERLLLRSVVLPLWEGREDAPRPCHRSRADCARAPQAKERREPAHHA